MIRAKAFLPFVLMSLLVVSACDNDGSSNNNNNNGKSFNATVSGDRTESFGGSALAVESHDATSGDVSWGVSLSDIDTGFKIIFAWDAARPGVGNYDLQDDGVAGKIDALLTLDSILDQYAAKSGRMTVTASSDSRVKATFNFQADYQGLDATRQGTSVLVSGSFEATNVVD